MKLNKMSRVGYNSRKKYRSRMKHKKRSRTKTKTKTKSKMINKMMNKIKGGSVLPPIRLPENYANTIILRPNTTKKKRNYSVIPYKHDLKLPKNTMPLNYNNITNAEPSILSSLDLETQNLKKKQQEYEKTQDYRDKKQSLNSLNQYMITHKCELFEVTSSFVQLRYYYKSGEIPLYFTINTSDLSVDTLQYFINNNKLSITNNKLSITDDNYISIDENTINIKGYKTAGQKRTGGGHEDTNIFIDVYEDKTTDMISYEENLKKLGYGKVKHDVGHIFEINLKNLENNLDYKLVEDVSWLKEITNDLNDLNVSNFESYNRYKKQTNLEYFLEQVKLGTITKDTKIFKCIDLNVDHTKLIIDKINVGYGEEYVIVGYPAEKMRSYLDLYNKHIEFFSQIYEEHKDNFMKYMAELYNSMPEKKVKIDQNNIEEEIYKFYSYDDYYKYIADFYENELLKELETDEITKIKQTEASKNPINKEYDIPYDPEFQKDFKILQKAFYNEFGNKCLNKPMMKINYVFLIFKKYTKDKDKYVPAIFNFRELKHKYHSILERLEHLIKTRLSQIYGILYDNETNYKLWYSHYNYGDVFHIKTEYVHTMSNTQQQAYKYKNSITLEELIYMLSIKDVNLINLRLDYQRKKINFSLIDGKTNEEYFRIKHEGIPIIGKDTPSYKIKIEENKLEIKDLSTFLLPETKIVLIFVETGKIYTIIYKNGIDNTFYKLKVKLDLIKCIQNILNYLTKTNIFEDLKDKILGKKDMEYIESIDIPREKSIKLYKVLEHKPISAVDFKNIRRSNPLLIKEIEKKDMDNKIINLGIFFQSPLFDNKFKKKHKKLYDIKIPNPYSKKSFLIRNILSSHAYITEFGKFNEILSNPSLEHTHVYRPLYNPDFEKDIIDIIDDKYLFSFFEGEKNTRQINRIYFNPDNCGYNLIAINEGFKTTIWVVPFNATSNEAINENSTHNLYVGNFFGLNNTHINVINSIKKIFLTKDNVLVTHIGSNLPNQHCLHFHILKNNIYKDIYFSFEQGTKLNSFLNIITTKNVITLNNNYYNNYILNLIQTDMI